MTMATRRPSAPETSKRTRSAVAKTVLHGLAAHPALAILPPLTAFEVERAVERVRLYGQRESIETIGGAIVAGLEEYEACVAAGVSPKVIEVAPPSCVIEYVCRRNVGRHLPVGPLASSRRWPRR